MSLTKQELKTLAAQVEQGLYVKRSTLYIAIIVALLAGLYIGNLLASSLGSMQGTTNVSASTPANDVTQISPQVLGKILDLEEHLQKDPKDVVAWNKLGHLYFDSHQYKEAIRAYEKSLILKPDDPDIITDLGVMYRRDHQHQRALETFERAIAANPRHETSHFNRGIVLYYDLKQKKQAFAAWRKLLDINPEARTPDGTSVKDLLRKLQGS